MLRPVLYFCATAALVSCACAAAATANTASNTVETSREDRAIGARTSLLDIAREVFARATSSSQVLTLNLTNLLILLILKAIILGFGIFSFGALTARSSDSVPSFSPKPMMSQADLLIMLTYMLGSATDNYDCMYRVACEDPSKARDYLTASKMMVKGAKMAKKVFPYNYSSKYENIIYGVQEAIDHKQAGGDCSARYFCSHINT